jgi:hypothetical protein
MFHLTRQKNLYCYNLYEILIFCFFDGVEQKKRSGGEEKMKRKILGIFVMMLLIATAVLPVAGTMNKKVIRNDNKSILSNSIIIKDPEAPDPPTITGPTEGKLYEKYKYEITTKDPQNDNVCFTIRFSDTPVIYNSDWCESCDILIYNHTWGDYYQTSGLYFISAKAHDCKGHESDWSTLEVTMPKNKAINTPFLQFLENHPHLFPLLRQLLELK